MNISEKSSKSLKYLGSNTIYVCMCANVRWIERREKLNNRI